MDLEERLLYEMKKDKERSIVVGWGTIYTMEKIIARPICSRKEDGWTNSLDLEEKLATIFEIIKGEILGREGGPRERIIYRRE